MICISSIISTMKIRYHILLLMSLVLTNCKSQDSGITITHKILEEAGKGIESDEFQLKRKRIQSSEISSAELVRQIDLYGSLKLIKYKGIVLLTCDSLLNTLFDSEQLLKLNHGVDDNGNLKNEFDYSHVNKLFLEENRGKTFKELFLTSEKKLMSIVTTQNLDIQNNRLPIKLNLFMEERGQTWEDYIFQNMPAMGLLPIFKKLNKDVELTKLLLLEKLSEKIEYKH